MLVKETIARTEAFTVVDVHCCCGSSGWSPAEESSSYGIVFARSGCFRRSVDGVETLVDATTVYVETPDNEQRIAHPDDGGDRCTGIELSPALVLSLLSNEPSLPVTPLLTTPAEDLSHRRLLAADDPLEAEERVVGLAAAIFERVARPRVLAGRPATRVQRSRLVDSTRELLAADPRASLLSLAREVVVSPHHLSRIFAAETGLTISHYRNRLRVRLALEQIAQGESSLGRIAADLGFADHAHLTRVVRAETGDPPSRLRELLRR